MSPCFGVGVLKFSFSILLICIWLNLMNAGVFNVKTSFVVIFLRFEVGLELGEFGLGWMKKVQMAL
jgi:hypothetical protein